jgi:hypothetical protein
MADDGQPAPMTSPDNNQASPRETGSTWLQRWSRPVAVAALPVAFVVGTWFPGPFADNVNDIESYTSQSRGGIEEVVSTESGTITQFGNGDVVVISAKGQITVDEDASAADIQRFNENVTMKSEALRQQVEAGEMSSEQAEEELALYTAREFAALTESNPSENQNQTINNFSQEVLKPVQDELISVLVEKLVSALLGGEGPEAQPGPRTTMETTSQ